MKACIGFLLICFASAIATMPQSSAVQPGPASAQSSPSAQSPDRIHLQRNTEEAEAVLAILQKNNSGQPVSDDDWRKLFATEPYVRLKQREASMKRDFTDDDFKKFVLSADLGKRAAELRKTLEEWKKADLAAAARRILPYLPEQAKIHAKVFPVIKPGKNSFVWETKTDPAIFLYLDPAVTSEQFENTVAHEMHHIGFSSIESENDARFKNLPPNVKTTIDWMGGFGEGFAMLAAAGSPDVHPHQFSKVEDRTRWDHDMANFNSDLRTVEKFFLDIVDGRLKTDDQISEVGFSFFGVQGPWYTVGYKMAVVIEKRYGRSVLIECMQDPRVLLARYNSAAAEINKSGKDNLAIWSEDLIAKVGK